MQENLEQVELKAIRSVAENDGDLEYLKGSNEYKVDLAHYQMTKMYGLSFKLPEFFAAMRDLKEEGFQVEAQISIEEEKIILFVTRNTIGTENESSDTN